MDITFTKAAPESALPLAGNFEEAERFYLTSLVEIISNRESSEAFAPIYRSLASLYETQGRFRTANILRREIIRIHEIELGAQHPLVALDQCELAIMCRKNADVYLANQYYKRGIRALHQTLVRLYAARDAKPAELNSSVLSEMLAEEFNGAPVFGEPAAFIRNGTADECLMNLATALAHLIATSDSISTPLPFSAEELAEIMAGVRRVTQLTQDLMKHTRVCRSERLSA